MAAALIGLTAATAAQQSAVELRCTPQRPTANRPSPYDSLKLSVGSRHALLCYGRPSAGGRTMIGGAAIPFGKLWRTGANEPTIIHLAFPAVIAGIPVQPGSYSIYTVPNEKDWDVIVNRSVSQWGIERDYTEAIKAQEIGRGKARSERVTQHVEKLVFRTENVSSTGIDLLLEWEKTRVRIPIRTL